MTETKPAAKKVSAPKPTTPKAKTAKFFGKTYEVTADGGHRLKS